MKKLVYTVCMGGNKYRDMLNMCLYSISKNGNFNGDIVVLSDFDNFDQNYNIKIINISSSSNMEWRFPKIAWHAKSLIFDYVDKKKYAEVMYLDIDTLINGDINKVFEQLNNYPVLTQHNDVWLNVKGYLRRLDRVYPIPHVNFDKYDTQSSCSGCVVFKDFKLIDEWKFLMTDIYEKNPKRNIGDQEILHLAIVNLGYEFKNIDGVGFQYDTGDTNMIISHFTNTRYDVMKNYFKRKIL